MDFLRETQTFMDQMDWVERFAWHGVKRDLDGVNEVLGVTTRSSCSTDACTFTVRQKE
jgi:hypothetical protein